jgi:hypothetical protein
MYDLALNASNDIYFEGGRLATITTRLAWQGQKLNIRLSWIKGEWYLDTRIGVPYYEKIWIKNPNRIVIQNLFAETALTIDGIVEVVRMDLDLVGSTRRLNVTNFQVRSDGLETPLTVPNPFILQSG